MCVFLLHINSQITSMTPGDLDDVIYIHCAIIKSSFK